MAKASAPRPPARSRLVSNRSMPQTADEPPIRSAAVLQPTRVGASGDAVAFLDAPGFGADAVLEAVERATADMPLGAIITVFTDDPATPAMAADWCSGRAVELVATIPHGDGTGTTLTLRRTDPPAGADTAE